MKILSIYYDNKKQPEFRREAVKAADIWASKGHKVVIYPIGKARPMTMRKNCIETLGGLSGKDFDAVAFFCHGTWKKLKLGWHVWNVDELAKLLKGCCKDDVKILLYACSTGRGRFEWPWGLKEKEVEGEPRGKDGFAFRLTYRMGKLDMDPQIFAHSSYGHTTKNPYVQRFSSGKITTDCSFKEVKFSMVTGIFIEREPFVNKTVRTKGVTAKCEAWTSWFKAMRSEEEDLRYLFWMGGEDV